MNRTVDETAAVLGYGPRKLFAKLRELKVIDHQRELISSPRHEGRFYTDTRSRWDPRINGYTHYGVVMITEAGVAWLAKELGIPVTCTQPRGTAA